MLVGEYVQLRQVTREDAASLAAWLADPGFAGDFLDVWTQDRAQWEQKLSLPMEPMSWGIYMGIERETGEPVGLVGYFNPFTRPELFRGLEIWGQIHPRFRKRKLAIEGGSLLIGHLFETLPVERIQGHVAVGNEPSWRASEAMGLKREGLCRGLSVLHGRPIDMYLYAILRSDWSGGKTR
jgi:RimJ/RimL family protein N-acetyltransferase